MKISDLAPNPKNPRKITPEKLNQLKKALLKFGDLSGVVFNRRTKQLVGGHQRIKNFDLESPVTILKKYPKPTKTGTVAEGYILLQGEKFTYREVWWDVHTEKAANIAANKGGGEWDKGLLGDWLKELSSFDVNFDLSLTMFDEDELSEFKGVVVESYVRNSPQTGVDEDKVPEKVPPRAKLGQIFELGRHRLMCGDATVFDSVMALTIGEQVDLVITDPPYNVGVNDESEESLEARNRRSDGLKIANDKMSDQDFKKFLSSVFTNYFKTMNDGASIYVFYADSMTLPFLTTFQESGFHFAQNCIWNKQQFVMTRKDYHYKHEPILYGWKKGKSHSWYTDRKQSSVWDFDRPFRSELHPTMKPIQLIEYALLNSSAKDSVVLDLFGGSGSTLIACEKNNRKCFSMELDPHYCDIIIERWEEYTGQKAKLISQTKKSKGRQ